MTLKKIINALDLSPCCGDVSFDSEVTGGYASDLLSNVIANSKKGDVWITMQVHSNIVAVAVLKELAAIIIVQGREPVEDTIRKAKEEKIPILVSKMSAFEVIGKLYQLGIGAAQ